MTAHSLHPGQAASASDSRTRVILAGAEPGLRAAVRETLATGGCLPVADVAGGVEAVELAHHYRPRVLLLLDHVAGSRDALWVVAALAESLPVVRTVLITPDADEHAELHALMAGAAACVRRPTWRRMLLPAVEAVAAGETLISRRTTGDLVRLLQATPTAGRGIRPVRSSLSAREWQVLDLVATGLAPVDVAQRLGMSTTTVRTHLKHINRKLGVRGRDAVIAAADELIGEALAS